MDTQPILDSGLQATSLVTGLEEGHKARTSAALVLTLAERKDPTETNETLMSLTRQCLGTQVTSVTTRRAILLVHVGLADLRNPRYKDAVGFLHVPEGLGISRIDHCQCTL